MISHAEFDAESAATEVAKAFSQSIHGKTIIITGVSPNSLGGALALAIAAHSPGLLILASRTPSKLAVVTTSILVAFPGANVKTVVLDLSDLGSVRAAVVAIKETVGGKVIDVLFNNAGVGSGAERKVNKEGIEMVWATNHLGGFALTGGLIRDVGVGRVVMVSSEGHRISPVRFSDWGFEGTEVPEDEQPRKGLPVGFLRGGGAFEPTVAYAQSKSANILHAVGLNRRGVQSFALHPGDIMPDLVRNLDDRAMNDLMSRVSKWRTHDQGAATMVVAGFDPNLNAEDGIYLMDCQMKRPSMWASDVEKAEKLWKLSEKLVNETFDLTKTASRL